MKLYLKFAAIAIIIFQSTSCLNDRQFPIPSSVDGPGGKDSIVPGTIVINEFLAKGSTFYNELVLPGNPNGGSDWIELFNTTNDTLLLESGKWFVTDSVGDNTKYELPQLTMLPKGFQVLWCDGLDTVITQTHTNFSLSKDGEDLGLFYDNGGSDMLQIDRYTFGAQASGVSFGRLPDGSSNWSTFSNPTPGTSNQ